MAVLPRRCARCQGEIPLERLEILPDTRLCIVCSRAVGSDFVLTVQVTNLGKAGSLKRGSNEVSVRKKRREIEPL
jgi:hypothetical protein